MRPAVLVSVAFAALLAGGLAGGCQAIAGLSGLETDPALDCQDGVQNGDEIALDCGGSCPPCTCSEDTPCAAGECVAGRCCDCNGYGCDEAGTCLEACENGDDCADAFFCMLGMMGASGSGECAACDDQKNPVDTCAQRCTEGTCDDPVCTQTCDVIACDAAEIELDAQRGPARLVCDDARCTGKQIRCRGPHPCEVECAGMSVCQDITVLCAPDGDCSLSCRQGACPGALLSCRDKRCALTCDMPPPPPGAQIDCAGACECNDDCQ